MNEIVRLSSNAIIMLLSAFFLAVVLRKKYSRAKSFLLLLAATALSMLSSMFMPYENILLRQAVSIGLMLLGTKLATGDSWARSILAVGIIHMNIWICELMSALLLIDATSSLEVLYEHTYIEQIKIYIVYLSLYALLLWIFALIFNRRANRLSAVELLLFAALPFSQCVLLTWGLYPMFYGEVLWVRILALIFCVVTDVGLYLAIRQMAQRAEFREKSRQLARQVEDQKEHYKAITRQYADMRTLRHDIANHMHTIRILLREGEHQQAEKYAEELSARHVYHSALGKCENPIADAFLYSRVKEAEEMGINMEVSAQLPEDAGIADTDLITAFGNLIDNAMEECERVQEGSRYIRLNAQCKDGVCTITAENSCLMEKSEKKQRIQGLERGIGLHVLEDLARQYGGELMTSTKDERFCAQLTLTAKEA